MTTIIKNNHNNNNNESNNQTDHQDVWLLRQQCVHELRRRMRQVGIQGQKFRFDGVCGQRGFGVRGRRSGNLGRGRVAVGLGRVETLFREILDVEGGDEFVPNVLLVDATALNDPVTLPHGVVGLAAQSVVTGLEIVQYLEPVDNADEDGDAHDNDDDVTHDDDANDNDDVTHNDDDANDNDDVTPTMMMLMMLMMMLSMMMMMTMSERALPKGWPSSHFTSATFLRL